jgi:hypothetical protein
VCSSDLLQQNVWQFFALLTYLSKILSVLLQQWLKENMTIANKRFTND